MKTTKLIVAVRSPLQSKDRRKAIRKSWGKVFVEHGAETFFVVSGEGDKLKPERREDVLYTPGTNTHGDLTNRMCWLWKYLNGLSYTHALIMDDDCSVNVPVFMALPWGDTEAWGHNSGGYLSGCAAVYSCETIKKLAYNMPKDDVVIGALLTKLKIQMKHAGTPCPIKPWKPSPKLGKWKFGDPSVAIQHYVRHPTEIIENHSIIEPLLSNDRLRADALANNEAIKIVKDIEFLNRNTFMRPAQEFGSQTAKIYVDKNKKYVLKELILFKEFDLIEREAHVLKLLNSANCSWAPNFVHTENDMLVTEYAGERVNKKNIPSDYKSQFGKILQDLKENGIKHNDIKKSEILVKNGKLHLCDFGWASINDDFSCGIDISDCKGKPPLSFKDENERIIKSLDKVFALSSMYALSSYPEQHLIIDWANFFSEVEIIKSIRDFGLEVSEIIHMNKLENKVEMISKFYDYHCERYNTKVDDFRGDGDFTVYIVNSKESLYYDYRKTSRGNMLVNTKLLDLKKALRKETGGYKIHSTDNIQETRDNLRALGLYEEHYNRKEFKNISEVFDSLNRLENFEYVVMRNFEGIPDDITIDEHLDVDLLVSDYYLAKGALDADSVLKAGFGINPTQRHENGGCRILNNVLIDGKEVWFDLRYVGDNYYDINLEKRMLEGRVKRNNFYVPDKETHFYTLMYHAIIHKSGISNTYKKIFIENGVLEENINVNFLFNLLKEYMDKNNFKCIRPKDNSVGFVRKNPLIKEWCCS